MQTTENKYKDKKTDFIYTHSVSVNNNMYASYC